MQKYNKKLNVSLTQADYDNLVKQAENDRRTINQMASIYLEDAIRLTEQKSVKEDNSVTNISNAA